MKKSSKVLVSIINWNNNSATNACLSSIGEISRDSQPDIILIDNNSKIEQLSIPESTIEKLRSIEIVRNAENLGFGGAHNDSLNLAMKNNYDYVVLLNNDTRLVDLDVFSKLTSALEENQHAIASAPMIVRDEQGTVWFAGGDINWSISKPSHRQYNNASVNDGPQLVEFLSGCCIAISVKNLRKLNYLFFSEYFMYWEDADWSAHATKAGYNLLYVPHAKLLHEVSSSLGLRSSTYAYYIIRNNILFIKRNTPLIFRPSSYFYVFVTAAKYELRAISGGVRYFAEIEKALLEGWLDGLMNRTGERRISQ